VAVALTAGIRSKRQQNSGVWESPVHFDAGAFSIA